MGRSLEDLLRAIGNPVDLLRNSQIGAYVYPVVPSEFSNWRDEQRAWRQTCALFDQSHHMVEQYVEGPDALALLTRLGTNSFAHFPVDRAKQLVPCSPDGHVIGDGILFHLTEGSFTFVGRAPGANWIQFHAETSGLDVHSWRCDRSPSHSGGRAVVRRHYRYQLQGPRAHDLLAKLQGSPVQDIPFFRMGVVRIAGRPVRALHHGMAGAPGLEIWGPYAEGDEIRGAILDAGLEFGLQQVGSRAYATNTLESGWIPSPLPAVYTGKNMRAYREWLPAGGYEGTGSLGGSYVSRDVEDYYLTPYDLGYGSFVRFDHDFIGRAALEKRAQEPHRRKVTFAWNGDDVVRAFHSLFEPGDPYKFIDLPLSNYASSSYDRVMDGRRTVGLSMFTGYSANERTMLSLGVVDADVPIGRELVLVWGEDDGGTRKITVERHRQCEIRVTVCPAPFSEFARTSYAEGWRTAGGMWRPTAPSASRTPTISTPRQAK